MRASLGENKGLVFVLGAGAIVFGAWRVLPLLAESRANAATFLDEGDAGGEVPATPATAGIASLLRPRTEDLVSVARRGSPFGRTLLEAESLERALAGLEVRGLLHDGERSLVLLGKKVHRVGDRVAVEGLPDPVEIEAILPGRIRFRIGERTVERELAGARPPGDAGQEGSKHDS